MPYVPPALLKKLYLKGSLTNTEEGFSFKLKNTLAPGTITAFRGFELDGKPCPLEDVYLVSPGSEKQATGVGAKSPFPLGINQEVTMLVKGIKLEPGPHKIIIKVTTKEVGDLDIPIEDEVVG